MPTRKYPESRPHQCLSPPIRHVCGNGAHPTAQQRGAPQAQHGIHTGTARSAPSKESRAMEGGKSPSEASTATSLLRHHRPRLPMHGHKPPVSLATLLGSFTTIRNGIDVGSEVSMGKSGYKSRWT